MTFEETIRAHGLVPRGPVAPTGRWHRCPTLTHPRRQNGAWKLATDGGIGWFQDHAAHSDPLVWRPDKPPEAPVYDPSRARRAAQEAREREAKAIRAARDFYAACKPLRGGHPYLEAHGLGMEGCYGLRVDRDGWLVVPALRGGGPVTVQRISPDGEKKFWPGAPVKGASYAIERRAAVTVLCEGLATGLALFAAVALARVVVAFNTGNLARVELPRSGMLAIAADNDHHTVCQQHRTAGLKSPYTPWEERPEWCKCNPGRCAAHEAATALGCGYALPEGIDGTDWSDYRQEKTAERMERRLPRQTPADVRRAVDAEIAAAIMRAAKFRTRG